MKRFIYQIGRFDQNYTKNIKFEFEGTESEAPLSSVALKNYWQNEAKLTLVYPSSIIFNQRVLESEPDEFKDVIKGIKNDSFQRANYFINPGEIIKFHPHNKNADDFIVIHSVGNYKIDDWEVQFNGSYDDIVLGLFIKMIEDFLNNPDDEKEFYVDISSGLNIYISALLEALRHFSILTKLLNWLYKQKRPKTFIVFSEPILGLSDSTVKIYKHALEYKVFFSSPVNEGDIGLNPTSRKLSLRLYDQDREKKRKLDEFLDYFVILFSALKNNTPLVLYHFDFHEYDRIIAYLKKTVEEIKKKLNENYKESSGLSKDNYLKVMLTLSFYAGIVEVLNENNIKPYRDNGVKLDEIKQKFSSSESSIYKIFDLDTHISWLGREIWNLAEGKDKDGKTLLDKLTEDWEKLDKYLYGEGGEFNERNFLAHAGFERGITLVRKRENEIFIKYDEKSKGEIENCLKKRL